MWSSGWCGLGRGKIAFSTVERSRTIMELEGDYLWCWVRVLGLGSRCGGGEAVGQFGEAVMSHAALVR